MKILYKRNVILLILFFIVASIGAQNLINLSTDVLIKEADRYYKEYSYKKALERYLVLKNRGKKTAKILFRIADSYFHLRKRNKAFMALKDLAEEHSETVYAARAYHKMSLLSLQYYSRRRNFHSYAKKVFEYCKDNPRFLKEYEEMLYEQIKKSIRSYRYTRQRMIEILKEYIDDMNLNKRQYQKAMYLLGMMYYRFGKYIDGDWRERRQWNREGKNFYLAKEVWEKLLDKYPKTKYADKIYFCLGIGYQRIQKYVDAIKALKKVIKAYPNSLYVSDAKKVIRDITLKRLTLYTPKAYTPKDRNAYITIKSRNIRKITFKMYRIELISFAEKYFHLNGHKYTSLKKFNSSRLTPVRQWIYDTKDNKKHMYFSGKIPVRYYKTGAYIIEAKTGNMRGLLLYIISDIAMLTKKDKHRVVSYVVNARNSHPIKNAKVYFHRKIKDPQYRNTARTRRNGIAIFRLKEATRKTNRIMARVKNNYAVSKAYHYWYYYYSRTSYTSYIFSDRTAYRPNHTVYLKGIIRKLSRGTHEPVTNRKIKIMIRGPQKIYEKFIKTSKTGTFDFKLKLPKNIRLGVYRIYTYIGRHYVYGYRNNGFNPFFRVEEYKRPEYTVRVSTVRQDFIIGDKVTAKIHAKYYYGQPVKNAKAVVTVRKHWRLANVPYYIMRKYYRRGRYWWHRRFYGYKNVIAKTLKTDEKGNTFIDFKTEEADNIPDDLRPYVRYTYSIKAKVVDSSRRQINGALTFNINKTGFVIKATPRRRIYTPGDISKIEVKTLSATGTPLSRVLTARLYKYEWKNETWKKNLFKKIKFKTSRNGTYLFKRRIRTQGYIVLDIIGYDKKQNTVKGSCSFWVVSEKYRGGRYRYRGIEILTDKKTYKPGDMMKVLLNTVHKGATLLVTIESNNIFDYKVVRLKGKSKLIKFRVKKHWSPNIFIKVNTVLKHKIYSASQKVIVPPIHHYITVKLKFKKKSFLPGKRTYVDIQTLDWKGRPVSAEVALSIFDKSLLYIQPVIAPDIRKFYYGRQISNSIRTYSSYSFRDRGYIYRIVPLTRVSYDRHKHPGIFGYGSGHYAFYSRRGYIYADQESGRRVMNDGSRMARGGAAPRPAMAPTSAARERRSSRRFKKQNAPGGGETTQVIPKVRQDFRETILWKPKIITNNKGRARVHFKFAESLTTWEVVARAIKAPTEVGQTRTTLVTTKNVIVRLQSPRFFRELDRSYISAIAHNYLNKRKRFVIKINVTGGLKIQGPRRKVVYIKPRGEYRADFKVLARVHGKSSITVSAITNVESDAMKKKFPILPYGADKFLAWNGEISGNRVRVLNINVPRRRRIKTTSLKLVVTPSIAMSMVDALPYLARYPYGCVEQTLSRFVPTVMVKKALVKLGIPDRILKKKINKLKLDDMVQVGLKRLYDFQHSSGGWGWWKKDKDNNLMSSLVVFGLIQARKSGYVIDSYKLNRGIRYLKRMLRYEENLNTLAYMLYALSFDRITNKKVLNKIYKKRNKLKIYTMSLLALTMKNLNRNTQAKTLVSNLEDYVQVKNNQAWWGRYKGYYFWYDDAIETTAAVVKAFVNIKPNHRLLNKAVRWLVNNRRGTNWKSTKDTAAVIYAFIDYIKVKREMYKRYKLRITFNGRTLTNQNIAGYKILAMNNVYEIPYRWIKSGRNRLVIRKSGGGVTYFNTFLKYFTKEKKIKAAGNLIHIHRKLIRLKPYTNGTRIAYKRVPWTGKVNSGDIVEIHLKIKAENDFSYLMIEDPKPAGCEPLHVRSGYAWNYGYGLSHIEFRDNRVAMFIGYLRQGTHMIRYRLRAEIPGDFSQMPAKIQSMYVPEFRGTSDSHHVRIFESR